MQGKIDEVTLDPSAVALGNVHLLDEVTSFAADAKILVDSATDGPGAMPNDTLLTITKEHALEEVVPEIKILNDIIPNEIRKTESFDAGWEQGTVETTGSESASDYRIRTDYIPIGREIFGTASTNGTILYTIRVFNSSKEILGSGYSNNEQGEFIESSGFTKYSVDVDSVKTVFPSAAYIRIVARKSDYSTLTPSDCGMSFVGKGQIDTQKTLSDIFVTKSNEGKYFSFEISFNYDIPGGFFTKGFLKLPPNYKDVKNVPLIVFVHGSGDISSINATSMTSSYNDYYDYLRDCGYAIFDCYPYSSKYSSQAGNSSNTWGLPINRSCYKAGIEYVLKNYNVDGSRIFVSCKSLGGLQAMSMFYDETIPITAVGMLAPEIDQFSVYMGYSSASKKIAAQDLEFSEDTDDVLDFDQGDTVPEGFWGYITANMQKWVGKFAVWCGLDISNADKPDYYQLIRNTSDKPRKSLNRPVKIWMASDDDVVDFRNIQAFISSLNNGGYIGELRTMPDNTGKHHAVDSDPSALQTTDVTTPLGVHYDSVPTAYYELEKWFRKWL